MVTMGFLSNVLQAVTRFFSGEGIVQVTTPREREEIFRRKIAKTGKSIQGNRNLFAFTFERNTTDRFFELIEAVEERFETRLNPNIFGYDDFTTVETAPFEYPEIEVGKE